MKNTILKSVLALLMAFLALPMMGQDFMNIYFKNGDFRKFYMKNILEITTSKFDANGVQHGDNDFQYITTIHDRYVYNLEDVDSITFTKIDEELAEQHFALAMTKVFPIINNCNTIEDIEDKIDIIKKTEWVNDAWCDGHQLFLSIAEGEIISFNFKHDTFIEEELLNKIGTQIRAMIPRQSNSIKEDNRKIKAVFANTQHKDESRNYQIYNLKILENVFNECGIEAKYVESPTVDFFLNNGNNPDEKTFFDYDIVFLMTHGGYGPTYYSTGKVKYGFFDDYGIEVGLTCHQIETSEDLFDFKSKGEDDEGEDLDMSSIWLSHYKDFKKWRDNPKFKDASDQHINFTVQNEKRNGKWRWVGHPVLTEHFFRDITTGHFNNSNSILFNTACTSLKGDDETASNRLAKEFFKRNLGTYLGYTDTNITGFPAGLRFYLYYVAGKSVEMSQQSLPKCYREETEENFILEGAEIDKKVYGAKLLILPDDNKVKNAFLFPTKTQELNQQEVMDQYNKTKTVNIYGLTKYNIYTSEEGDFTSKVSTGFLWGNDMNQLTESLESNYLIDLGKCEHQFSATIRNLTPNNTYYYCAYTYDGMHYNYGDTLSFTIEAYPPLSLSSNTITVSALTSSSVQITSGSGSYSIESIIPSGIVTASIIDNKSVAIEANTPGTAVITVKDNITGETATITVTVTGIVDTRELMFTKKVGSTVYSMYKKTLSDNDYHINPDGWKCYRSELSLDITKNGNTNTYVVDNNIYLDKKYDHHGGQQPCMLLDFNKNMMYIFCNSKDDGPYYSMDGNFYSSSMNNIHFSKETVFEGANWGWYPYFCDYGDDNIYLCNFSFAGYFTIMAVREGNTWELYYYNTDISPEQATREWEMAGPVLVIGQEEVIDERIPTIIPDEIRDEIEQYIPIYDGVDPPNIEGTYYINPQILIGSSLSYDQIGTQYNSQHQKFSNQDMTKNTIDMVRVADGENDWSKGNGAFISGSGNNFTVYFDLTGESRGIPFREAYIISGTKTDTGIRNITFGFVYK